MARIETDPNYTSPTFSRATAATDPFKKEDVQQLAAAFSAHEHGAGKGLAVSRVANGSVSSAALALPLTVASSVRSTADTPAPSGGAGIELLYTTSGGGLGQVHSYDRTVGGTAGYRAIMMSGSNARMRAVRNDGFSVSLNADVSGNLYWDGGAIYINAANNTFFSTPTIQFSDGTVSCTLFCINGVMVGRANSFTLQQRDAVTPAAVNCGAITTTAVTASGAVIGSSLHPSGAQASYIGGHATEMDFQNPSGLYNFNQVGVKRIMFISPSVVGLDTGVLLQMVQGNRIYWSDTNSAIASISRTTYFDEYNSGWIFRNSATGFPQCLTISGTGEVNSGAGFHAYVGLGNPGFALSAPNTGGGQGQGMAVAWLTYSSAASKTNIVPFADAGAKVDAIRGYSYDSVSEVDQSLTPSIGFIAEEVEPHIPEVVSRNAEGVMVGMDYSRMSVVLWEEVRSLRERVSALEAA